MEESGDATQILKRLSAGDPEAGDQLVGLIYDQLHELAEELMRRERPDHTLQATALVNEAYLKLVDQTRVQWKDRAHFLAVAAKVMRRILIDHARHHGRAKRGGDRQSVPFDELATRLAKEQDWDLISLDEALRELETADSRRAQIVELRYFGGLSVAQVAEVLDMRRSAASNAGGTQLGRGSTAPWQTTADSAKEQGPDERQAAPPGAGPLRSGRGARSRRKRSVP